MVPDFFAEFLLSIRLLPISSVSPMGTWCWDQQVSQLPDVSALNVTDRHFVKSTSVLEVQLCLCECFPWAVSPDTNSRQNTLHRLVKHSICRLGLKSHLSVLKLQTLLLFGGQNLLHPRKSNTKITYSPCIPSSETEATPRLLRHVANKRKTRASPAPFPQDVSAV